MKIDTQDIINMMSKGKKERLRDKVHAGELTFDDCGLDSSKNFLLPSEDVLIDTKDEIEDYAENLRDCCLIYPSAVFLVFNDMNTAFALRFNKDDSDYFDLDDKWNCWNFISIEKEFDVKTYGLLCETEPGRWKAIMR